LSEGGRAQLLKCALKHPDGYIRIWGAAGAAEKGDPKGEAFLVEACRDRRYSAMASAALFEAGREGLCTKEAGDLDLRATSSVSEKLDAEAGRYPDHLELTYSRDLYWPPTEDSRSVSLVSYKYDAAGESDRERAGYGLFVTSPKRPAEADVEILDREW